MLGHAPFYNESIKKLTSCFGTLFNDLKFIRVKGSKTQTIQVPLQYSSKDKAFVRREMDPDMNQNFQSTFPRMAFQMTNLSHDVMRKMNSTMFQRNNAGNYHFAPVPYDLTFELYIGAVNMEDGLQILEQILPFFNPEYTVSTKDFPDLNINMDVPFILDSVSFMDNTADSDFSDARLLEWTLSFTCKGWIFGPARTGKLVEKVNTFIFNDATMVVGTQHTDLQHLINPFTVPSKDTAHTVDTTVTEATII